MKREYEIEQLILNSDGGLTHRELARKLGAPEPSVRRSLQALRAARPRFKAGKGTFNIVAVGERRFGSEAAKHTVWGVRWLEAKDEVPAPREYDPTRVTLTITGKDGGVSAIEEPRNEPGDFDAGSSKVA